jgi:hypothetical protein
MVTKKGDSSTPRKRGAPQRPSAVVREEKESVRRNWDRNAARFSMEYVYGGPVGVCL